MMHLSIKFWNAWGPAIQSQADAREWAAGERDWGAAGKPDVSHLPAMFRRRLSMQSRMVMAAIRPCAEHCSLKTVRTLFASRWGESEVTAKLLAQMAEGEQLSPMDFSLSVHNTAAGLFSIHHENHQANTAIAGGRDTFCYGMVEAASLLHQDPDNPVLLIVSDERLPAIYGEFIDEKQYAYALAMLLTSNEDGIVLRATCEQTPQEAAPDPGTALADPQAILFLRWLNSDEPALEIRNGRRAWRWERA
jgi:hypothetical protein